MTNTELDIEAERASFKALMRSEGWGEEHFELVSVSEGKVYRSSHMGGAWSCWLALAARRATIQPTACQTNSYSNSSSNCVAPADAVRDAEADDLRALGLTVAVHNDYRLNGEAHTFWLFTDATGMSYKGEGRTDAEALNAVRAAMKSTPKEPAK